MSNNRDVIKKYITPDRAVYPPSSMDQEVETLLGKGVLILVPPEERGHGIMGNL